MSIFDTENDFTEFAEFVEKVNQIKINQETNNDVPECPICLEAINNPEKIVKTCCNHMYCQPCYDRISVCALCRSNLNKPIQHRHNQIQNDQIRFGPDRFNFTNNNNNNNDDLRIYATNYNVLRIMSGMGGLAYSS